MFRKISKKKFALIPLLLIVVLFIAWWFDIGDIFMGSFLDFGKTFVLTKDARIKGKQCYKGDLIALDWRGFVSQVVRPLDEDTVIRGIPLPKGTKVCLDESGEFPFQWAELSEDYEIQGIKFPKGTTLFDLYKSGKLESVDLPQVQEIQGIKCAARKLVYFNESGKLDCATLAEDQKIQGIEFPEGTTFVLSKYGNLSLVALCENCEIQGIKCGIGHIYFYESGKLKSVRLSEDQEIQGNKYHKGDTVYFDKKGNITKSSSL